MTSPVATVGVEYDGFDCQQVDLQIFIEIIKGLNEVPSVRGTDSIVPALAGRAEGLRINDVLKIELAGFVRADPALTTAADQQASYRTNMDTVRGLFATNRLRADLVATLEDGTQRTISARPLNMIVQEVIASIFVYVSIELEGYDDWGPVGS